MTDPTEPREVASAVGSEELEATIYSKDYWDLVLEQLGKRPLFKLGMAVLALLYASAIYAPFLANDRPLVIEAVDLKGYRGAISSLSAVTTGMAGLMKMGDEEYTERLRVAGTLGREGVPADRAAALVLEERAGEQRLEVIRRALPGGERERLAAYEDSVEAALSAFRRGEETAAVEAATQAKTLARALRRELVAWDPRSPEKDGVRLVGHRRWPLLEALSAKEVFFMVLWLFVLAWPVWNPLLNRRVLGGERERIRRWRRRKVLGVGGASVACALLWTATPFYGEAGSFDTAPFKGALAAGDMWLVPAGETIGEEMADTLVWPPVAYGTAETHSDAETNFRPPTWSRHARIDAEGRYESGPRKRAADSVDPTGYEVPAVPVEVRPGEPSVNHSLRRIAGTDELGRDFFTRILWGGRVSLMVGILSAVLLTLLGVVVGSIAGYFGGWVDIAIMRLIEIIQSLPAFFLILMAMAFTDPKVVPPIVAIVVVIALIRWTGTARLVRGEFLRLREQEFVLASQALGFSDARTIFRHVLPNALSPVLVSAAFAVAAGILTESAISFLGFGTRPPDASWGALVNESKNPEFWWIQVFPGVLIFITVTCYNLVGEAIRDALDPKMKL
ncbi:MAG: hypothetical protein CMJ84_10775 [Planctomycetes bacterium]|jgi:peptide/nickel transport system permease protein|nr:hypothetical protein [Planctomycetota bacterium]MDP6409609.1 ABC transporter permease [Planctomycetota bacterium]